MRATIKENIILNQEVDNNKLEKLVKIFNLKLPMDYCIDSEKMVFVVSHDVDVKEAFRLNKLQVV